MKSILSILSLLLIATAYAQADYSLEEIKTNYTVIQMESEYFPNEKRTIKVALPKGYDSSKKHPVIYVLDGSSLFELTSNYVSQLSKLSEEEGFDYGTDAIPQAIVIGVFHKDRGYETQPNFSSLPDTDETNYLEGSEKLKNFLFHELVPYIDLKLPTSGYNAIVGHSNTGHFVMCLPFQKANPFKGILALSVSGDSENLKTKLKTHLEGNEGANVFIGYGTKDFGYKEFAQFLEKEVTVNQFKVGVFNANHTELPALSLTEGIKHLFRAYRNMDDFIEASNETNFDIKHYIKRYESKNKAAYGIETSMKEDDFLSLLELSIQSKNSNALKQILDYDSEINGIETQTHMLFIYNKQIEDFDKAEKYAYQMLNSEDAFENRILKANLDHYYDFFAHDLKDAHKGLHFFTEGKRLFEDSLLEFSYFTASISIENNFKTSIGKSNLEYCGKNYKSNPFFTERDLERLCAL